MWSELYLVTLVMCLCLVVPGYLALRAFGLPRAWAACISPLAGISLVALLGQAYALVGIASSPLRVLAPLVLVFGAATLLGRKQVRTLPMPKMTSWMPLVYVAFGVALGYLYFSSRLPAPDAMFQQYDLTQHLNLIQAFSESGRFSSLGTCFYLTAADQAINPAPGGGFYPAAYHAVCALVMQATGASAALVINASQLALVALVFPLAMCAFLSFVFGGERRPVLLGAATTLAFVVFPWTMLLFGPTYPNLAAFCAFPAAMALFMGLVQPGARRNERVRLGLAFVGCCLGLALLHPNAIFAAVVILTPYCVSQIWKALPGGESRERARRIAGVAIFLIAVLAFWAVCYVSPLFRDTVKHVWNPFARPVQEIVNILSQTYLYGFFNEMAAQVVLAALVITGFARMCRRPQLRWLAVSYLLLLFLNYYSACEYGPLEQFLTGFWYTDPMRLASMACIVSVPIAAFGLDWVWSAFTAALRRRNLMGPSLAHARFLGAGVVAAFLVLNFLPEFSLPGLHASQSKETERSEATVDFRDKSKSFHTTFGDYRTVYEGFYAGDKVLNPEERSFLQQVRQTVGSDLVVNDFMDGSFLAYGYDGMRVYYRNFVGFGGGNETPESKLVRERLSEYATNAEVRDAVNAIGAKYVLQLDQRFPGYVDLRGDYDAKWTLGIRSVTPSTPGFKLLMHRGALSLYEIEQ